VKPTERPFVVGRKTSRGTTLVVLERGPRGDARVEPRPWIRGPWTLRAVVTPLAPK
jgi:hypothetical protein